MPDLERDAPAEAVPHRPWPRTLWPLAGLLLGYLAYAAWFIQRSSFLLEGRRYYSLQDEAMISLQYARNLVEGHGLVWMPGADAVEGFASPFLVGWMALFHLLPVPASQVSLYVQIGSAVVMALNLVFVFLVANELIPHRTWLALVAAGMTAFYLPLNLWGLMGTEVGPLVLAVSSALWLSLRARRRNRFSPWPYLLLGAAAWIRLDACVPYFVIWAYQVKVDREHRKQHLIWGGLVLAVSLILQTALRQAYFGDALPGVFRWKLTGMPVLLRLLFGAQGTMSFIYSSNWALFLIPFLVIAVERSRDWILVGGIIVGILAFNVFVGGDTSGQVGGSNRYVSVAMPLFFIAFCRALDFVRQHLPRPKGGSPRWREAMGPALLVAAGAVSLLTFHATRAGGPNQVSLLSAESTFSRNRRNVSLARFLNAISTPEATIAAVDAGAISYFSDRTTIDLLGKSDAVVLRGEARPDPSPFLSETRRSFIKYSYDRSIDEQKPDVIVELVPGTTNEAQPYLNAYANVFLDELKEYLQDGHIYLKIGSPYVKWDLVEGSSSGPEIGDE